MNAANPSRSRFSRGETEHPPLRSRLHRSNGTEATSALIFEHSTNHGSRNTTRRHLASIKSLRQSERETLNRRVPVVNGRGSQIRSIARSGKNEMRPRFVAGTVGEGRKARESKMADENSKRAHPRAPRSHAQSKSFSDERQVGGYSGRTVGCLTIARRAPPTPKHSSHATRCSAPPFPRLLFLRFASVHINPVATPQSARLVPHAAL